MELQFSGPVVYWRGPAPWYFIEVPDAQSAEIESMSTAVTYGWGVIPVTAQIDDTTWTTSIIPKDGAYLVPVRAAIRKRTGLDVGDVTDLLLTIAL